MSKSQLSWLILALALAGVSVITGHPAWGALAGGGLILLASALAAGAAWIQSGHKREGPKGHRVPTNLVTLSAAAIIAVYAAGFQRTRSAADEFEAQAARRRAHPPVAGLVVPPKAGRLFTQGANQPGSPRTAKPLSTFAIAAPPRPAGPGAASGKGSAQTVPDHVPSMATAPASIVSTQTPQPEPTPASNAVSSAAPPTAATEVPSAQPSAAPANSLSAAPSAATMAASADASPAPATDTAGLVMPKLHYKDGTYLAWGRCAHGRIQASVTIKDGRIASADIARCETAYSCDVIAALPGRVLMQQDSNVDGVTGATDSSYAFQDAVAAAMFRGQRGE